MSTNFDIFDRVYPHLNCTTITTLLGGGGIYRHKKPLNSVKRDIVLKALMLREGDGLDVQPGTMFVNCFAQNLQYGLPDDVNLKLISDAVVSRIGVFNQGSTYLHLEIIGQDMVQDDTQDDMSYSYIRLNVITE